MGWLGVMDLLSLQHLASVAAQPTNGWLLQCSTLLNQRVAWGLEALCDCG